MYNKTSPTEISSEQTRAVKASWSLEDIQDQWQSHSKTKGPSLYAQNLLWYPTAKLSNLLFQVWPYPEANLLPPPYNPVLFGLVWQTIAALTFAYLYIGAMHIHANYYDCHRTTVWKVILPSSIWLYKLEKNSMLSLVNCLSQGTNIQSREPWVYLVKLNCLHMAWNELCYSDNFLYQSGILLTKLL